MKRNLLCVLAVLLFVSAGSVFGQGKYTFKKVLDTVRTGNGMIVDRQGRIWYQSNGDSIGIQVMNPNGTKAAISGIFEVTIGATTYNVAKGATGMNLTHDGNILVACGGALYKINAQTGAGMLRVARSGLSRPAVDNDGYVYSAAVVGPSAIMIYDQNLSAPIVADTFYQWGRGLEVSPDGKDIYAGTLWQHVVQHWHSNDLITYTLVDTLTGPEIIYDTPIVKWDRNGRFWVGQQSGGSMYVYNTATKQIVDSLVAPADTANRWIAPRALDFSLTGDTLYILDFTLNQLQMWSTTTTSVQDRELTAQSFALHQNFPNPFNPTTEISYMIAKNGSVRLEIFNLLGQSVRTVVDGQQTAGTHTVQWNGRDHAGSVVPSGVYFYTLTASSSTETKKMLLMK